MKFLKLKSQRAWLCLLTLIIIQTQISFAAGDETPDQQLYRVQKGNKASFAQIKNLKDDQKVELSNGRQIRAGRLKTLADLIRTANKQSAKSSVLSPAGFSRTTAAGKVKIKNGYNLRNIEKMNSADTIQLPSGRSITAADFKKLDQLNKKMNGKSLLDNQPALSKRNGPTVKIKSSKELVALESKPDSTVITNAFGKRISIGELRAYAKKNNKPFGVK